VNIPAPSQESRRRHPTVAEPAGERFAHPSEKAFSRLLTLYGHGTNHSNFPWRGTTADSRFVRFVLTFIYLNIDSLLN
jgi:hypothetical protein